MTASNQSTKVVVVTAIVDTQRVTFYKTDGTTIVLLQGDPRLKGIMEKATLPLSRRESVEIDLADVEVEQPTVNHFVEQEKKSKGLIRFFHVARRKVVEMFNALSPEPQQAEASPPIPEGHLGASLPEAKQAEEFVVAPPPVVAAPEGAQLARQLAAVAEVMKHAEPVSTLSKQSSKVEIDYSDQPIEKVDPEGSTIIAVVETPTGPAIVPNVERLSAHIRQADRDSAEGINKFLARLGAVIGTGKRRHSVDDLMGFVRSGDLPIASNGDILIYKRLQRVDNSETFIDVHSKKVTQKLGSLVIMDESLVDPNRHQDCSNGLHVAQRSYLNGFSGDVLVVARVRPEDVIAVPAYNRNKMRVCAYHIIHVVSEADAKIIINGKDRVENTNFGKHILGALLAGHHPQILEEVRIRGNVGTNLLITPRALLDAEINDVKPTEVRKVELVQQDEEGVQKAPDSPPIEPSALLATLAPQEVVTGIDETSDSGKAEILHNQLQAATTALERQELAKKLRSLAQASGTSLPDLGLPEDIEIDIAAILDEEAPVTQAQLANERAELEEAAAIEARKNAEVPSKTLKKSRGQIARELLDAFKKASPSEAKAAAQALVDFRRKAKVGWDSLGISVEQAKKALDLLAETPVKASAAKKAPVKPASKPVKAQVVKVSKPANAGKSFAARIKDIMPVNSRKAADEVLALKKQSKKGWSALGVDQAGVDAIEFWLKRD